MPEQLPLTHAWPVHATAAPYWPLALQVCTPLLTHWVAPGTQRPVHAPPTHAEDTHAVTVPQVPFALHV
jgi:hypothetical protein